jgi:hypothetical protein
MPKAIGLSRIVVLFPLFAISAAAQGTASNWEGVRMLAPGTEVRVVAGNAKAVGSALFATITRGLVPQYRLMPEIIYFPDMDWYPDPASENPEQEEPQLDEESIAFAREAERIERERDTTEPESEG